LINFRYKFHSSDDNPLNTFQNKVTVFAGPGAKTIERTIIRTDTLSESLGLIMMTVDDNNKLPDENADAIGRMASAIAHIFLSDKKIPSVNVSINLEESSNESQTEKAS
uniref:RNase_PH domain-containing protein n=1 Tax=Brugia pahangi TaxID=6280 RepID=A0A0N4TAN3_BRUPA